MNLIRRRTALLGVATLFAVGTFLFYSEPAWAQNVTLTISESGLGPHLTDASGKALYFFDGEDSSCTGFCANKWPPLLVEDAPSVGEGLDSSLVGTVELEDGSTQVSYNGHPLHYFSNDSAGSLNGQGVSGFGGNWTAVSPQGEPAGTGETTMTDGGANKTNASAEAETTEAGSEESAESNEASAASGAEKLNPHTGDDAAIQAGQELFTKVNCYGCHGREGGGGMGPSLVDAQWEYAGDDAAVFKTIKEGRPNGMPAFGENLSEDEIWQVVAFMRSLYKGPADKVQW